MFDYIEINYVVCQPSTYNSTYSLFTSQTRKFNLYVPQAYLIPITNTPDNLQTSCYDNYLNYVLRSSKYRSQSILKTVTTQWDIT